VVKTCGMFGVTKDGDNAFKRAMLGRLGECVEAVLTHKAGTSPGAVANKVDTTLDLVQAVAR